MGGFGVGLAATRASSEPDSLLMLDAVVELFLLLEHEFGHESLCIHSSALASCCQ